jgi:hypothetical protein
MMTSNFVAGHARVVGESDAIRAAEQPAAHAAQGWMAALGALFRPERCRVRHLTGRTTASSSRSTSRRIVTQLVEWLTSFLMPWKGKFLICRGVARRQYLQREMAHGARPDVSVLPRHARLRQRSLSCVRLRYVDSRKGRSTPIARCSRIDYDRPDNPAQSIRRIVDEIVEVRDGVYLGKVHFKWWWGRGR